jgi:hypothetical protein
MRFSCQAVGDLLSQSKAAAGRDGLGNGVDLHAGVGAFLVFSAQSRGREHLPDHHRFELASDFSDLVVRFGRRGMV